MHTELEHAPARPRAGDVFRVLLVIGNPHLRAVTAVDVTLRGSESQVVGGGKSQRTERRVFFEHCVHPSFENGAEVRLESEFTLPSSAPPSFVGGRSEVKYEALVRVRIDWLWFDHRARFTIPIEAAPLSLKRDPFEVWQWRFTALNSTSRRPSRPTSSLREKNSVARSRCET